MNDKELQKVDSRRLWLRVILAFLIFSMGLLIVKTIFLFTNKYILQFGQTALLLQVVASLGVIFSTIWVMLKIEDII
jgi:hypothetical protein